LEQIATKGKNLPKAKVKWKSLPILHEALPTKKPRKDNERTRKMSLQSLASKAFKRCCESLGPGERSKKTETKISSSNHMCGKRGKVSDRTPKMISYLACPKPAHLK
jgi:hypothetical protein